MPIPVTIVLTEEARNVFVYDHYSNDKELITNQSYKRNETIPLDSITSDGSSTPEFGRLLMKADLFDKESKKWKTREVPFDVVAEKNPWPRETAGLAELILALIDLFRPKAGEGGGAAEVKAK